MPDDLEREFAVASAMRELIRWGPSQGDTAQDKRVSLVSEILLEVSAFLTHQTDSLELFDLVFGETERRQYRLDGGKRHSLAGAEKVRVNPRDSRVIRNGEIGPSNVHSPNCARNVIRVVANRSKSSQFVGDRRLILFSAICRKPLYLLAKRLLRQDLAN